MRTCLSAELLVTFTAIVDRGKSSLAAEDVNRTQSAVSMQVKKLEELVGSPLFQRDRRDMALASSEEMLLTCARKILQLNEDAVIGISAAWLKRYICALLILLQ
jgi:DNA-binding transcriptional LysR family regulator